MISLRERGIYALSDGREFIAHAVFRGGYVLYLPGDWEFFGHHTYETDKDGLLRLNLKPTCWHVEDLIDTNRTAHSRSKSGAALKPITR